MYTSDRPGHSSVVNPKGDIEHEKRQFCGRPQPARVFDRRM